MAAEWLTSPTATQHDIHRMTADDARSAMGGITTWVSLVGGIENARNQTVPSILSLPADDAKLRATKNNRP
jgi:hypothetical protein